MDALRLIRTSRHALAEARSVPDALAEAWQAGLLTEAVGARIAERESGETGALGQLLCDAGAHTVGCLDQSSGGAAADGGADQEWSRGDWGGTGRAARLDELGELEPVLEELGRLLHEVAETLVVLACGAGGESLYWRCIDGVDAGAECKDLVAELLRTVRKQSEDESTDEGSDSPDDGHGWYEDEEWDHRRERRSGDDRQHGERLGGERRSGERHCARPGGAPELSVEPDDAGTGPVADRCSDRSLPTLVIPLAPPGGSPGYRPPVDESAELSTAARSAADQMASASPPSADRFGCAPAERRSAPRPASESLTDASRACICSSRLPGVVVAGVVGAVVAGTPVAAAVCGGTAASDLGSDMWGPLRLGGAT
ncbi:hypothetical protein UK12_20090 [Saccharothrix sp. ST-888]|nr:DUF6099 family protein [Saccharothrix sp. ST-888]KJK56857.1 hypothetical protein UK12_20090 [Saccharothrix sp. ST-888]